MARFPNEKLRDAIFAACGVLEERPTSTAVLDELARMRFKNPPGDRQVRRYLHEWAELSEGEKAEFRIAHWPEVFIAGLLPWGAAPSIGEMESVYGYKATVREARWYWRVVQSFPDVYDPEERHRLALRLHHATLSGDVREQHAIWFQHYPGAQQAERERTFWTEQAAMLSDTEGEE